jgi:hypothetical protein
VLASFGGFLFARQTGGSMEAPILVASLGALGIAMVLERLAPHRAEWNRSRGDAATDWTSFAGRHRWSSLRSTRGPAQALRVAGGFDVRAGVLQDVAGKTSYNPPMFPRRRHRLITVLFALCSLLFMQLAVAGYGCPMESKVAEVAAMAEAGMPCAGDMASVDAEQPGLCHAHCQSTQQTADKLPTLTPTGAVATGFTYSIAPAPASQPVRQAGSPLLRRTTPPPIALRNCCLRI